MENLKKINPILFTILFVVSCSNQNSDLNYDFKSNFSSVKESIFNKSGEILQGYHSMGYSFTEKCLDNIDFIMPINIENTTVSYEDNLKESDFRQKLNIGTDLHAPVEAVDVVAGINYSKQASVSKLSRSTTYYAYVKFGESKLKNKEDNKLYLRDNYKSYFDENGNLNNPYNFVKKCGDEVVTSQIFSSKPLVTLKLNFESQFALDEFNTKIGGVLNAFIIEGANAGPTAKLNYLSQETKRQIRLDLYGIQIGGQPEEMMDIISSHSSCKLDNIKDCSTIFQRLNKYISQDYKIQLNEQDIHVWSIESSRTTPYDKLSIFDKTNKPIHFNWTDNFSDSTKLSKKRAQFTHKIAKEIENYRIAQGLLDSSNLAYDERIKLLDISEKTMQNINFLKNYSSQCYVELKKCLNSMDMEYTKFLSKYDDFLLKPNIGKLISKIRSDSQPSYGQKNRSSQDFLNLKNVIENMNYASIYFKLKTVDNKLIRDTNLRFNLMCNKPWYRGFGIDHVLFTGVYSNYEIMMNTIVINYERNCSNKEMVYIANPSNVNYSDFIVEVWGRE
ncbi:hypothetical protein [Silvanigrella sp.]|jgi:hypothetical protein|uniref:hypothetical protein n=1 Tax=Silvanigrella sp. TaxID=2024976 RepID=UPI0037C5A424